MGEVCRWVAGKGMRLERRAAPVVLRVAQPVVMMQREDHGGHEKIVRVSCALVRGEQSLVTVPAGRAPRPLGEPGSTRTLRRANRFLHICCKSDVPYFRRAMAVSALSWSRHAIVTR